MLRSAILLFVLTLAGLHTLTLPPHPLLLEQPSPLLWSPVHLLWEMEGLGAGFGTHHSSSGQGPGP